MEPSSPSTGVDGGGDDVHRLSRAPVTPVTSVGVFSGLLVKTSTSGGELNVS